MPSELTEIKKATGLRSMTGFGQAVVQEHGFVLTVSLRSVNHRSLDLHLNLPEQLQRFEPEVRKEIVARHPRGHLQLKVTLEREGSIQLAVDEILAAKYVHVFRELAERFDLPFEIALATLSQLPGVVAVTSSHDTFSISPQLESAFLRAVRDSVSNWDEMRAAEGSVLEQDLRTRGFQICGFAERMEQMRQDAVPLAQKKLRERLQQWLGQSGFDSARLAQEAALLAERTDISEEVLRLKAHSAQFVEMLGGGMEIGKKLDFLLQEIQRELNTLMAKTTGLGDSSLAMTQLALDIKGEVEKLREQVLNLQ